MNTFERSFISLGKSEDKKIIIAFIFNDKLLRNRITLVRENQFSSTTPEIEDLDEGYLN
jgi:hypothetical protein